MTNTDWAGLIIATNEAAMQWYSMVSQKPLPATSDAVVTPLPGGGHLQVGTNTILILGAIVVAVLVFRK